MLEVPLATQLTRDLMIKHETISIVRVTLTRMYINRVSELRALMSVEGVCASIMALKIATRQDRARTNTLANLVSHSLL